MTTDKLIKLSIKLIKHLNDNEGELSREAVLEILGVDSGYYSIIVNSLVNIEKINRIRGKNGGIRFRSVQGLQKRLTESNEKKLRELYNNTKQPSTPVTLVKESRYEKVEEPFYLPVQKYLKNTGDFDIVEVYGNKRGSSLFGNPDLLSLYYPNNLKYCLSLMPELTAYEVKAKWPTIKDAQQTASYLRFAHRAMLLFYHESYSADSESLYTELKDHGIWDWADLYRIGITIIYKKQGRSSSYSFHKVKEPPYNYILDASSLNTVIEEYFTDESKLQIRGIIKEQLKELL
nr:hypothetical protein [uncultured Chitinophaga sp.]